VGDGRAQVMNKTVSVCMWCAIYNRVLVELSTVTVILLSGEHWHAWYCATCKHGGQADG